MAAVFARWRRLNWVTWRQHRTSLLVVLGLFILPAAVMAATGLSGHWHAVAPKLAKADVVSQLFSLTVLYLLLLPVVTGLVLGAPLLAHEAESGLTRFAWTQSAGRSTLLTVKALSMAAGLAIAAAGLGLEFGWWAEPLLRRLNWDWPNFQFSFHPLPFAGWTVFAFCLGVALGSVARRTVPALVGTLVGYATVFYQDNEHLRRYYLPPLRTRVPWGTEVNYGPFGFSYLRSGPVGRFFVGTGYTRSEGQPFHWAHWSPFGMPEGSFNVNKVVEWMTYQPASRYVLFQFLEFGYLILLSVLLIAAAVVLIRRRPAAGGPA
jgi:hypothetical protein